MRTPDSELVPEGGYVLVPREVPVGVGLFGCVKRLALFVVAHPDDVEFAAGGLVARLVSEGTRVVFLVATRGERGRDVEVFPDGVGFGLLREGEQRRSAEFLGVEVVFLDFVDGETSGCFLSLVERVCFFIRFFKPDLLVTSDPFTRLYRQHPDHRNVGAAVLEAMFPAAGSNAYFSEQLGGGVGVWDVPELLLIFSDVSNFVVELSGEVLDVKVKALSFHHSQRDSHGVSQGEAVRRAAVVWPSFCFSERFLHVSGVR